jgi:hypothetical protein
VAVVQPNPEDVAAAVAASDASSGAIDSFRSAQLSVNPTRKTASGRSERGLNGMKEVVMPFGVAGNDDLRGYDGARWRAETVRTSRRPVYANLRATAGRSGDMGHAEMGRK